MTNTMQATEPNWKPLERALELVGEPTDNAGQFMWMFRNNGESPFLVIAHDAYKHIDTRHYLRLTGAETAHECRQALAMARS